MLVSEIHKDEQFSWAGRVGLVTFDIFFRTKELVILQLRARLLMPKTGLPLFQR